MTEAVENSPEAWTLNPEVVYTMIGMIVLTAGFFCGGVLFLLWQGSSIVASQPPQYQMAGVEAAP